MARCLLLGASLPKRLWTYAVMASAFIRNRCYNPRTKQSPIECLTGHKPDLRRMHVFGSICYAYVQNKTKLDARSEKGVFVGYDRSSAAYLVYFPSGNIIKRIRCVKFTDKLDEPTDTSDMYRYLPPKESVEDYPEVIVSPIDHRGEESVNDDNEDETIRESTQPTKNITVQENAFPENPQTERFPIRTHKKPKYLEDYVTDDSAKYTVDYCYRIDDIPKSYKAAISSSESHEWQIAMDEELFSLRDNNTFELVPMPQSRTVVG
ncbi:Uncharacterised protein r2_g1370 [Pycnogonum litorale]